MLQLALFFSLFLLSACSDQKKQKIAKQGNPAELEETVARMSYIPDAPFGFRLQGVVYDQHNPKNVQILYRSAKKISIDFKDLRQTYLASMEMLGWDFVSEYVNADELFLLFSRPGKMWCQVRCEQNILTVVMMVGQKKDRL
ncbi:hypothetical protein A3J41_02870 [candidate division TM6 bacterium RIFCSPHIGHO2_12_FULL_38_8]|nr:MAG: hypothetical protein A3J41_02870 [candidate division TM6 bacterium RIFCSPHIGHO2_12_FULL_38_8]